VADVVRRALGGGYPGGTAMLAQIAWKLCILAFDASRDDDCVVASSRRLFRRFGVICYWVALTVEGRALAIWRDLRAEEKRRRRLELREGPGSDVVAAWSLPRNTRMKGLGLGRVWSVVCPFCGQFHIHAPSEGRRRAHCSTEAVPRAYVLQHDGEMPLVLRERFRLSVKRDLPRFLVERPDDGAPPALEAA